FPPIREAMQPSDNPHVKFAMPMANGATLKVPLQRIPNIAFGKLSHRGQSRLFFPALWASGEHLWSITQATYAKFYDTILLPSIRHVSAVSAAHWPISYSSAMNHARDARGHYHYQTLDVNYTDLVELETQLLERMDQDATFKGAFWEHELRGTKDATGHEFEDVDAHRDRFESFISILNMDRVVPAEWCVDVAVEISIAGFNVAWLTVAHSRILAYALPDVHPDHLTAISRNKSKFTSDVVAHLDGVAGCRVDPGRYCGSDGVSYINVYTTDKSNTYQQWLGSFARIRTAALLPKGIKALLRSMSIMGEAFAACRTTSCRAGDISQDGHARFEVRVPIANALTAMTRNMDDLIGHAVICIPNQTWWSVRGKIWRQLPEGPRVCAPHLYVNPRFAHKHFTLRAASNEIGEDSDVDST
ncbi:predicted protein, partial [Postia placenta Mad-698-R]